MDGEGNKLDIIRPGRKPKVGRSNEDRGAPDSMMLPIDRTYTYLPESDDDGEPKMEGAVTHNPFYFSPGLSFGYSEGLRGKGLKAIDPGPDPKPQKQWGDPDNWYG